MMLYAGLHPSWQEDRVLVCLLRPVRAVPAAGEGV